MTISTVILAAGQGTRMRSATPKVLHKLAGKSLLEHVITTSLVLSEDTSPIIIYGYDGEKVKQALAHLPVRWIAQNEQLGTGHAVLQTLNHIPDNNRVLILYGDVPLITQQTLKHLVDSTGPDAIGILTAIFANPFGFGRIIRNAEGEITQIIEEKEATDLQRQIKEINSGIYLVPAKYLKKWLPTLNNKNSQQEYYLTDIIALAAAEKIAITSTKPEAAEEVCGINDRVQLSTLERYQQGLLAENLMRQGVTIADTKRLDIRGDLSIGQDCFIDVNVIFEGQVTIGNGCRIGPNTIICNTHMGNDVEIRAHSVIEGANIGEGCIIGPFARIRPGSALSAKSHIGNFVEIKNSNIGTGTKISHLSYIGDSDIGKYVNIGAGTITCNYDGINKHKTIIGDHAFIGSDTQLIAPVTIGEGSTIGAGSTITHDTPPAQLTLSRAPQRTLDNWKRPIKKED